MISVSSFPRLSRMSSKIGLVAFSQKMHTELPASDMRGYVQLETPVVVAALAWANHNWGFNADVGMAAQSLGATVRLGRAFGGGLSMSDALRDLRLQPVVRLGVTYSF